MAPCRLGDTVVAESQSHRGDKEVPFEGYSCHVHVGAVRGMGIDV